MSETHDHRLKRLAMRAMRRGIKEMDIILSRYATARLPGMTSVELDSFDALLWENDHDLYQWVTGQMPPPERYAGLILEISEHVGCRN
ncbi:MAG: succinate dehydrogenase assembly factor 2 [Armatimonadetes bacterium CG_4_10_14_3_um_filter_59_10]|nr:succinate dehydrogenase assembly factor 2 [Roseovarius sp.]PIV78500.1 MAG: succinate dehydrogenase assembly factor 2 [Rhodobacteraceae bacterium CG17_big_fil_post_rev_8_21_14_2_50_63_15]PIY37554.1 MAG: succinate dehydrogenase assembly factor 2 [Armatimonadetes bacterium CG_4_10_14_3_um_filter_59_10]